MAHLHPTVLILDDDDGPRDNLARLIRTEGYAVDTARNGQEALEKLRGGALPCIILTDLQMPEMDGFEFRDVQLADPNFQHIPVVLYSAAPSLSDYAELLNAAAFVRKPTELERLMALIRKHCLK
jgi:CheY-like chemotaxis protein